MIMCVCVVKTPDADMFQSVCVGGGVGVGLRVALEISITIYDGIIIEHLCCRFKRRMMLPS